MRGTKAKHLRKTIYGLDYSPRARTYTTLASGTRRADVRRHLYQQAKKRQAADE